MSTTGEGTPPLAPPPDEPNYKQLMRNSISLIGLALAAVAIANIIFLFILDLTTKQPSPYIGIFAYMLMPNNKNTKQTQETQNNAIQQNKHRRKKPTKPKFPRLDFNNPAQRST